MFSEIFIFRVWAAIWFTERSIISVSNLMFGGNFVVDGRVI